MLKQKIIRNFYGNLGGHGFDHVVRVNRLAIIIAGNEKSVDTEIVDASSWLHDIARSKEDSGECECHAEEGSILAGNILREINFPKEKIPGVQYAIKVHRFSKNKPAETIEAKILQDADRLDALGAICIARVFTYNGYKERPIYDPNILPEKEYHGQETTAINHFYEKILKIKPSTFHTKTAQRIAEKRYQFIENFLEQFKSEWDGNS